MIIRVFQVQVQPGMHGDFEQMSREVVIPQLQAQAGLIHLYFGTPMKETPDAFLMITMWKDLESLKAFTGEQWREAVLAPGEAQMLKSSSVRHYQMEA